MKRVQDAKVLLWGTQIGAVSWLEEEKSGVFQYTPEFVDSGIQPAPFMMPLRIPAYQFPGLSDTFKGLPGMLSDSLPDNFGTSVINAWLSRQGMSKEDFSSVERLCIIANRGMGALEFEPAIPFATPLTDLLEIEKLVELTNDILNEKKNVSVKFDHADNREALVTLVQVGISAGGARAKAIVDWNPLTGEFRSGQIKNPEGFGHWIIKFDGVSKKEENLIIPPQGFGKIEFVYAEMARLAGINMPQTHLYHEGGRSHFMIKRFDRDDSGDKIHMQSLGAIRHVDFNSPGSYSYEETLISMKQLELPASDLEEFFRRAVFNVFARNNDDHVKNIAFLMDRLGRWRLSPAYDLTFACDPESYWLRRHQMTINGKADNFCLEDLNLLGDLAGLKKKKIQAVIEQVRQALKNWRGLAEVQEIDLERIEYIGRSLDDGFESIITKSS